MSVIKTSFSSIRSSSQTRSNRSRSRSGMRAARSSPSMNSRSRSRSAGNSTGSRQIGETDISFRGLENRGEKFAFEDPELRNESKEVAKSFWRKFTDNVWNNDNTWIKLFLILSCFSAIICLTLECAIFGLFMVKFDYEIAEDDRFNPILAIYGYYRHYLDQKKKAMASYLALYIYAMVYQIGMTLVVLYTRNVFHLISSILFLIAMAIYSGIQWSELDTTITNINAYNNLFSSATTQIIEATKGAADSINALSIAVIVLACLVCIMQAAIGLKLKDKFQQSTGETIGNSNRLIAANVIFNLHRDALLLAVFFCPAFFLQSIIISPDKDAEFGVSFAALFISFPIIVFGDYFICREKKIASVSSFVLFILGLIFVIFKIARIYIRYSVDLPGRKSVVAFGVITVLLLSILIVLAVLVIKNFGLGLYQIYAKNYNWISNARDKPVPNSYYESEENAHLPTGFKNKESVANMETSPLTATHASIVATTNNGTHAFPQRQEIDF